MIQLADIDGTIPGRAVILIIRLDDPEKEPQRLDFIEGGGGTVNPLQYARDMQRRINAEIPEATVLLAANPRARYLEWRETAEGWGHNLLTPTHYLATSPAREAQVYSSLTD